MPTPRSVQRVYLLLTLGNTLAAVGGLCLPAAWLARAVTDESTRRSESEHVWECPPPARSSARISS